MDEGYTLKTIARIHSDFPTKFGIPRQSGLCGTAAVHDRVRAGVPRSRSSAAWRAFRISGLSGNSRKQCAAAGAPPCARRAWVAYPHGGVRHPFAFPAQRPGPVLCKAGRHYTGCRAGPCAGRGRRRPDGWHSDLRSQTLSPLYRQPPRRRRRLCPAGPGLRPRGGVPGALACAGAAAPARPLTAVLAQDPRPSYQADPDRVYGFFFAGLEVKFTVQQELLTVCGVAPAAPNAPSLQTLL